MGGSRENPPGAYARPRVIRGTRVKPLPLLPSGPGGVHSRPLHEARSLTNIHASTHHARAGHFHEAATMYVPRLVVTRHGPLAQRLEQWTHNPLVVGSNPT